jgi:hypothetical protein
LYHTIQIENKSKHIFGVMIVPFGLETKLILNLVFLALD